MITTPIVGTSVKQVEKSTQIKGVDILTFSCYNQDMEELENNQPGCQCDECIYYFTNYKEWVGKNNG